MTLKEFLKVPYALEGYRKIQCWESEDSPTIYHEGYDNTGLPEKYLDREISYIFPFNTSPNEAAICIEVADVDEEKVEGEIDLAVTASVIVDTLECLGFNDCTNSSGYYVIKRFEDDSEYCVDVYKSNLDGYDHYVVYCSYDDDTSVYAYTEDLSAESLEKVLRELAEK